MTRRYLGARRLTRRVWRRSSSTRVSRESRSSADGDLRAPPSSSHRAIAFAFSRRVSCVCLFVIVTLDEECAFERSEHPVQSSTGTGAATTLGSNRSSVCWDTVTQQQVRQMSTRNTRASGRNSGQPARYVAERRPSRAVLDVERSAAGLISSRSIMYVSKWIVFLADAMASSHAG